ncbi:hypothetical protein SCOCK_300046 [Actinacidiphila cocklensis]|uniref:Uncharacterized protein n=1 Tax=Actinacidiphila cocklensis TaxID=887465 RepID=A0A9W4DSK1_9ACTN|nr:hypothetical protein SCOCK_300046 [Actinacidiphila cocklensis]
MAAAGLARCGLGRHRRPHRSAARPPRRPGHRGRSRHRPAPRLGRGGHRLRAARAGDGADADPHAAPPTAAPPAQDHRTLEGLPALRNDDRPRLPDLHPVQRLLPARPRCPGIRLARPRRRAVHAGGVGPLPAQPAGHPAQPARRLDARLPLDDVRDGPPGPDCHGRGAGRPGRLREPRNTLIPQALRSGTAAAPTAAVPSGDEPARPRHLLIHRPGAPPGPLRPGRTASRPLGSTMNRNVQRTCSDLGQPPSEMASGMQKPPSAILAGTR